MNIFISYTLRDGLISKCVLANLKQKIAIATHSFVYVDILDNHEEDHQNHVFRMLRESDIIVLIASSNIEASEWVECELAYAKKLNKKIFTLTIQEVERILCDNSPDEIINRLMKSM